MISQSTPSPCELRPQNGKISELRPRGGASSIQLSEGIPVPVSDVQDRRLAAHWSPMPWRSVPLPMLLRSGPHRRHRPRESPAGQ
ncbi:unnamed protein product [Linum trigynum]|uniref:Uncharacterized protein n=1 Tax=Linum trigynum TaxID=586398 RepID=A0AAV2EAP4_9ROSI